MAITSPRVELQGPGYRAMSALSRATHELPLEPRLRELIRVRASMLNGCAYCVDMHTKDARAHGRDRAAPLRGRRLARGAVLLPGRACRARAHRRADASSPATRSPTPSWPRPRRSSAPTASPPRRGSPSRSTPGTASPSPGTSRPASTSRRPGMSAAALRALHVPGDPLILPNAWDAATAKVVEEAGFPAVATTSSGVAEALGFEDGEQTPRRRDARRGGADRPRRVGPRHRRPRGRLRAGRRRRSPRASWPAAPSA